jgi:hypothetical protein
MASPRLEHKQSHHANDGQGQRRAPRSNRTSLRSAVYHERPPFKEAPAWWRLPALISLVPFVGVAEHHGDGAVAIQPLCWYQPGIALMAVEASPTLHTDVTRCQGRRNRQGRAVVSGIVGLSGEPMSHQCRPGGSTLGPLSFHGETVRCERGERLGKYTLLLVCCRGSNRKEGGPWRTTVKPGSGG